MIDGRDVEILLVEDNPRDAELTIRALRMRRLANNVVRVEDGQEALDWLLARVADADGLPGLMPKVVMLDLKLPKVDGLAVLRAMRADPRLRTVPVVVLTSSREERDIVESYRLGVNSYIVKPVDFDNFSTAIAEAGQYWLVVNQVPTP